MSTRESRRHSFFRRRLPTSAASRRATLVAHALEFGDDPEVIEILRRAFLTAEAESLASVQGLVDRIVAEQSEPGRIELMALGEVLRIRKREVLARRSSGETLVHEKAAGCER